MIFFELEGWALDKELKDLLDARERKAKTDAQEKGGGDSQKGKPEVSADGRTTRA